MSYLIYLVVFMIGLLVGITLAALFLRSKDIGDLCVTRENGKDLYYMAIDEDARSMIPKLRRVFFHVRIM